MKTFGSLLLLFLFAAVSCTPSKKVAGEVERSPFYTISDSLEKDGDLEAWLEPYREIYHREMGEAIAISRGDFEFGKPESTLGNLVADMLRFRAAHELQSFVHLSLINLDGFQIEFEEGEITIGQMYEFMPYDNTLVILEMKGSEVRKLADDIAGRGGVPQSGMRMTISDGKATGLLVNSEGLDPGKSYYLATSSYVAGGGGSFEALQNHENRYDYSLLIRDLFIDHFKRYGQLFPEEDQRIRTR